MDCSCAFKKLGSLNAHISKMHISVIEVPSGTQVRQQDTEKMTQNVVMPHLPSIFFESFCLWIERKTQHVLLGWLLIFPCLMKLSFSCVKWQATISHAKRETKTILFTCLILEAGTDASYHGYSLGQLQIHRRHLVSSHYISFKLKIITEFFTLNIFHPLWQILCLPVFIYIHCYFFRCLPAFTWRSC